MSIKCSPTIDECMELRLLFKQANEAKSNNDIASFKQLRLKLSKRTKEIYGRFQDPSMLTCDSKDFSKWMHIFLQDT